MRAWRVAARGMWRAHVPARWAMHALSTAAAREVPREERRAQRLWCRIVDVYDGDTVTIVYRAGGGVFLRRRCRLWGIDAPERRAPTAEERAAALAAREHLCALLRGRGATPDAMARVRRVHVRGLDKYGRLLIGWRCADGAWVADAMVRDGHAVVYHGGTKARRVPDAAKSSPNSMAK